MTIETVSNGATYCIYAGDADMPIFITINEQMVKVFKEQETQIGRAFKEELKVTEIFVRIDSKEHFEIVNLVTRLASMALRAGVDSMKIAKELQEVYSMTSQHIIPGTNTLCPSIIARIGIVLEQHINKYKDI